MSALPLRLAARQGARFGLAATLTFLVMAIPGGPRSARAGQIQTLPSQQDIPLPQGNPPALRQQPEIIPRPPTLPGPQGNTREIPLPRVFHGCWAGEVASVDSIEPLGPQAGRIEWLRKSYTLCYKQTGNDGRWQLTFADGSVADRREVWDQRQSIKVNSVNGPERAQLTAYLHFRAPQLGLFGERTGAVNTLDELTSLDCVVVAGGAMQVLARVFVEMEGRPYARIFWHTRLRRTAAGG